MSDAGVTAILAELAVIREDMAALNKRMDALTALENSSGVSALR